MNEISNRSKSSSKPKESPEVQLKNPSEKQSSRLKDLSNLDLSHRNAENLEASNSKKVNTLTAEVDRLSQENRELSALLHEERMKSGEVQRKVKNSGKIKTIIDRNLQNELKHEKEEAVRLRHLLNQIENERSDLLNKIKDLELAASSYSYEKKELVTSFHEKNEVIQLLEDENRKLVQALSDMNNEFKLKEGEVKDLEEDRKRLCSSLIIVENQKADVEARFNLEKEKVFEVNTGKKQEIENIKFVHNKHSKVLAGHNLLLRLTLVMRNLFACNFKSIQSFSELCGKKSAKVSKFLLIPSKCFNRRIKKSFDTWRTVLNWKSLSNTCSNLVFLHHQKSFTIKHFSAWRKLFIFKRQEKILKFSSCEKIFKVLNHFIKKSEKKFFRTWVQKNDLIEKAGKRFFSIFLNFCLRKEKLMLLRWKTKTHELKKNQAFDDLAGDFAAVLLKSKYFRGLRHFTQIRRMKREFESRQNNQADLWHGKKILNDFKNYTKTWNNKRKMTQKISRIVYHKDSARAIGKWKLSVKSFRFTSRLNLIFKLKIQESQKKDSEKCFFVWKEFLKHSKFLKCLNELNYEKPLRLKLQQKVEEMNDMNENKGKFSAFKVFTKNLQKKMMKCLKKWKSSVFNHRKSVELMVKFIKIMRLGKVKSAVGKWKDFASNMRNFLLNQRLGGKVAENQLMVEHIQNLEKVLKDSSFSIDKIKKQNFRRVLIKIKDFRLLTAFRSWGKKAFVISNKTTSAVFLSQALTKAIFRLKLLKISEFSSKMTKKRKSQKIFLKLSALFSKNRKFSTFFALKTFANLQKSLRKSCKKFLKKKSLIIKKRFIQTWQNNANDIKSGILKLEFSSLLQEKEKIFSELSKTCENFEAEQETSSFYLKSLKKRSSLRIFNAFNNFIKTSALHYFSLWRQKLRISSEKSSKISKIVQVWLKNQSKKAFNKWLIFLKVDAQEKAQQEIKKHIHEKKVNVRAHREAQGKLEAEVQTKEIRIKQLDVILTKEIRVKEFLLNRCVKHFSQEYSENRAAFAFKLIKSRFLSIKSASYQLAKRVKHAQKRFAFEAIVETVKHMIFVNTLYEKLYSTFFKFSKLYQKRLFEMWKINSYEVEIMKKIKKIAQNNQELNEISTKSRKEREKYLKNVLALIFKDRKKRVLNNWLIVSKKCKSVECAFLGFQKSQKEKNFRKTLKNFSKYRKNQKQKREKLATSDFFFYKKTLLKAFKVLKHRKNLLKSTLTQAITRNSTKNLQTLLKAFQKLHQYSQTMRFQLKSLKNSQNSSLSRLFLHISSKSLENSFKNWKLFLHLQFHNKTLLKRSVLRGIHRKYSKALKKWQDSLLIKATTEKVNRSGEVAMENALLREKSEILELLVKSEGIDSRYVERFIQERESLNLSLTRRGVSMLKYRAGLSSSKDMRVLPKSFLTWRLWTVKRKRIKKVASRLCLYRHKTGLVQGFNIWKRSFRFSSRQPRHLLISEISKLRLKVKSHQTELQSSKNDLVYMKAYSSILEGHTKRGQNLTLVLLRQNVLKTYFQSFLRWVVHCNLCKVHELLTSLTHTEERLYMTQSQLKGLGHDYYILEQDNLELRQASLDGVAIADAFETLSKEREKLTNDLAERTATIKKLLEHNNLLTFRLRQFESDDKGKEAVRFKRY